ncbi:MarR family winged helix-turn-helix transcriptional regulator [Jatrophihabitans sp. YIM 134969]
MGTAWLDDAQQGAWRAYLQASNTLWDALDRQLQRDSGINHAYYEILVTLSESPGHELRMSELAEQLLSSRSRLSHAVARLEERGWVERVACETDRRGQNAHLTEAGFAALVEAAPGHVAAVRATLVDVLTPEQLEQLRTISEAIKAASKAYDADQRADLPD